MMMDKEGCQVRDRSNVPNWILACCNFALQSLFFTATFQNSGVFSSR
jgi:lysozyme family protein